MTTKLQCTPSLTRQSNDEQLPKINTLPLIKPSLGKSRRKKKVYKEANEALSRQLSRKVILILEAKRQEPIYTPFKKDYIYHKYVHSHNKISDIFSKLDVDYDTLKKVSGRRLGKSQEVKCSKKKGPKKRIETLMMNNKVKLVQNIKLLQKPEVDTSGNYRQDPQILPQIPKSPAVPL